MTLQPGTRLGTYEIMEKIGAGGMGAVYKGYQTALGRYVAIKVLPPQTAGDPAFAERFAQEAKAIGKLRHPNIVAAFDFAHEGDLAYLVSEFIDGGTLADQLGAPLPLDYAIGILTPVAGALDYAHARGVVHRDVKPQNILLTHDGTPVLTDFGLAKIVGPGSGMTQAGSLMGTAEYIAPECASGAEVAGPGADQYALGLIAYQLLVGRHPFPADNPLSALMAHVHKPVPLPSTLGVALPPGVEAALLRALAKRPEERFARCSDMVRALLGSTFTAPAATSAAAPVPSEPATRPPSTPPIPATPSETAISPLLSASAIVQPPASMPARAVATPATSRSKTASWWRTRKIVAVPVVLLLILFVLAQLGQRDAAQNARASGSAVATVADDHGNTAQTGTLVTLPATSSGRIDPAGDLDVFNFAVRAGQEIQAELRLGSLSDGGLTLLNPAGDQVAAENAAGNAKSVTLSFKAKDAGPYHLVVHGVRGSTGAYQVVITAR